jgi:ppGpp synthetase/RelA/SpoT-type nucleotidyltranferase
MTPDAAALGVVYDERRRGYDDALRKLVTLLREVTEPRKKAIQSLDGRVKERDSFIKKANRPRDGDDGAPRYSLPFEQITDIVAFRVITYFADDADAVSDDVCAQFDVIERVNKGRQLDDDRFGYQSIHLLLRIESARAKLLEWKRLRTLVFEVQIRTVLQHAWAEIEHDMRYKTDVEVTPQVRRRFAQLAGLLEIADREFVQIRQEDQRLRAEATQLEKAGRTDEIELTGGALRRYFDSMNVEFRAHSSKSYNDGAQILELLGIRSRAQFDELVAAVDIPALVAYLFDGVAPTPRALVDALLLAAAPREKFVHHPFQNRRGAPEYWEWLNGELARFRAGQPVETPYAAYRLKTLRKREQP